MRDLAKVVLAALVAAGVVLGAAVIWWEPTPRTAEPGVAGTSASVAPDVAEDVDEQLRSATEAGDLARVQDLLARGADVNAKNSSYESAYLISTSEGHLELLRLFLAQGADVSALDSYDGTGLIRAAERGHHLVVGELLRAGVSRDHVNNIGYQAIHEAVWFGDETPSGLATVLVLVAGGVQLDRPSETEGLTPLQMAQKKGYAVQAAILQAAQQPATADPVTALLTAAWAGDAAAVAAALRAGADIGAQDSRGRTALGRATANGHALVVELLTALGAPA